MPNFAYLNDNGIVENVIIADSKEIAEAVTGKICFESTSLNPAFIGFGMDGDTFLTPPPAPEPTLIPEGELPPVR